MQIHIENATRINTDQKIQIGKYTSNNKKNKSENTNRKSTIQKIQIGNTCRKIQAGTIVGKIPIGTFCVIATIVIPRVGVNKY